MEAEQLVPERKSIERHTALKIWICQLTEGRYVANPGWESNYILYNDLRISRANVFGVVVQKSASRVMQYDHLAIDDGTGRIMVRTFEDRQLLQDLQVGDLVNVIGRPREYGDEIYLVPEIAKKISNPLWIEVRKRELEHMPTVSAAAKDASTEKKGEQGDSTAIEDDAIVTPRDKLLTLIRELDKGEGVDVETILTRGPSEQAEKLLQGMLLRGDIFEIKPGRIKLLE